MSKQEEGKNNEYYKYALELSKLDLINPVGILDSEHEFKEPQSLADKILIRQNNVIIHLQILQLKKLDEILSCKSQNSISQEIENLTTALKTLKTGSDIKRPPRNKNFAVWDASTYGKTNDKTN